MICQRSKLRSHVKHFPNHITIEILYSLNISSLIALFHEKLLARHFYCSNSTLQKHISFMESRDALISRYRFHQIMSNPKASLIRFSHETLHMQNYSIPCIYDFPRVYMLNM